MGTEVEPGDGEAEANVGISDENVEPVALEHSDAAESYRTEHGEGSLLQKNRLALPAASAVAILLIFTLLIKRRLFRKSVSPLDETRAKYDSWGLPMLEHFENTLPEELKLERNAIAMAAAQAYTDEYAPPVVPAQLQSVVASALSGGQADSLVGLTVDLEDVMPSAPDEKGEALPRRLEILGAVGFDSGGVLQQPIAVPVYTANIAGAQEATLVNECYVFRRVQLMERLQGNIMSLDLQSQVLSQSKDYTASRLLQMVLKLQEARISSANLDWNTLLVRFDGTFVLETFHSSGPFGSALGAFAVLIPHRMEPQLALSYSESKQSGNPIVFHPSCDMWSLGTLLYELFTGELPYNSDSCTEMEQAKQLAEQLLTTQTRSEVLRARLDAADVSQRWKELTLRLLEPNRAHRITSMGIMQEFPDLARHITAEART
ncbi:uncharacterized protein EMH_0053090 [Eimeria mitis]|uniref:Protein kinase domain-containing protein n=1 Tax=Eimeria mitis TaxID=44415 RepID=U6JWR4_9EIME|nr:uncharacterized protein EMH_0053090 [Eimeria mitis]CDJ29834.1 hypothetical protein, conserved [Eimeria mitis]